MRSFSWGAGQALYATLLVSACVQDARDPDHDCQVLSQNDTWSQNNVDMHVTSPRCPVPLSVEGQTVSFSSTTIVPANLPQLYAPMYVHVYDAFYDPVVPAYIADFSPVDATHKKAQHSGNYPGGLAGLNVQGAVTDRGVASFVVNPQYGTSAEGEAQMRYKFTVDNLQTVRLTPSFLEQPKRGLRTWLAVVPQIDELYYNVTSYEWYFDNKRVIDTAASPNPLNPVFPKTWFQAKVNSPGTHTWKVIFKYGHYPTPNVMYTFTKTWTQTWP